MKKPAMDMLAVTAGDVGARAVGFLITLYLARVLAPSSFGLISIGLAVLGYLALLGSPGIQMVETRNAAATEGGMTDRAGAILSLRLALAPLLIAAAYFVSVGYGVPGETRLVIGLYSLSLVPLALSLDWLFQGKEDFRRVVISRLLTAVVFGLLVVVLVRSASAVALTPVAFLGGNAAGAAYLGAGYLRRYGRPSLRWDPSAWRRLLGDNAPAGLAMLLAQSVTNLPPIVIGIMGSIEEAGIFSAGMKLIFVLMIVDRTINALFLPVATRFAVGRKEEFPELLSAALGAVIVTMVPVLICTAIVAGPLMDLLFGEQYEGAVPVVRILSGYILLTLLNSLFVCTLMAFGRTRAYAIVVGGGAVILCAAVIGGTAFAGMTGSAWGVVAGEALVLAFLVFAASRLTTLPPVRIVIKPVAAGAAMAIAAVLLAGESPWLSACASLAVFAVVLVALGGLPWSEIRYLKERLV